MANIIDYATKASKPPLPRWREALGWLSLGLGVMALGAIVLSFVLVRLKQSTLAGERALTAAMLGALVGLVAAPFALRRITARVGGVLCIVALAALFIISHVA